MKIVLPFFSLLIINLSVSAATIQINPVKDNTLYETENGNLSNGTGTRLFIGKTGENAKFRKRRAVLQFDLSDIPPNSTINSATFEVTVSNTPPDGFSFDAKLHLLLADWGEGQSNGGGNGATAAANDATWQHRFYDTTNWNTAGGDFFNSTSATAKFNVNVNEVVTFSSDPGLVADVQLWLDTPTMNFGWILLGDEISNQNARGINSRESATPPILTINFTAPDLIFADGFE